jgi:acylglycerol lipase
VARSGLTDLNTLFIRTAKEKMQHREGHFQGINKTPLYFQSWTAVNPKGLVMVVHGYGEHSGRYQNVVDALVPEGYALWALDHRSM